VPATWLEEDIESLEAIAQDALTRRLFLRLARVSSEGSLERFLHELAEDCELDPETKASVAELAADASFLHAVEEYVHRTRALH
jgi:hypothetical protein